MPNPTLSLAEAVREAMNYGSRTDMLIALQRALRAHDSAQPSPETHVRIRAAYWIFPDGKNDVQLGYDPETWDDCPAPTGYISAWVPKPVAAVEVEGEVE